FTNTTTGRMAIKFDTWNRTLGLGVACATTIDTGMQIRDAAGMSLANNDDRNGALDRCSSIIHGLNPGESIYVHVVEFGDRAIIAGDVLQARYLPTICGNGVLEPTETCDDGNLTAGDGCSAACAVEPRLESEPNNNTTDATGNAVQVTGDVILQGAITPV